MATEFVRDSETPERYQSTTHPTDLTIEVGSYVLFRVTKYDSPVPFVHL
jgi:hypothetical protein